MMEDVKMEKKTSMCPKCMSIMRKWNSGITRFGEITSWFECSECDYSGEPSTRDASIKEVVDAETMTDEQKVNVIRLLIVYGEHPQLNNEAERDELIAEKVMFEESCGGFDDKTVRRID